MASAATRKDPATRSKRSTSSSRDGRRAAHKPLKPFTVDHFRRYARLLVLDSGEYWALEAFQEEFVNELFSGIPEVWLDVPEGNGKTTLLAGVALYHGDYTPSASVPIAASSKDQTRVLFGQAAGFVFRTPGLESRFRVLEGFLRINCLRTGGRLQVYAADDRTGDGVIPTLALLEELHRHVDLRLYRTWRGKLEKRGGQLAAISTPGAPGSEYENVKESILQVAKVSRRRAHTVARTKDFVLHKHGLQPGDDIHDLKLVKQANPFSGVTLAGLRRKHDSPTMRESHWARFTCGLSMETEESWISPEAWDACKGTLSLEPGQTVVAGVDVGQKKDSTAVAVAGWVGDRLHVQVRVKTPRPGQPNAAADARAEVGDLNDEYRLLEVPFDPWHFSESAEMLLDRGVPMVEFPQTDARMAPASEALYELIMSGRLVHDGDPELRRQILAAVPARTERGVKISKRKSKRRIDAAVALAMAAHRAVVNHNTVRPTFEVLA